MLWTYLLFITIIGACVGSFLNVVVLRLPEGMSVVTPPSHDPATGRRLSWWENIPIASYVALRGRDRVTRERISIRYPLVELGTALLFGGLFAAWYQWPLRSDVFIMGLQETWPALVVNLLLIAGLIAVTLIDAKYYRIPLQVTWIISIVAIPGYTAAAGAGWLDVLAMAGPQGTVQGQFVPLASVFGIGAALGGMLGLMVSLALLQTGLLPRSFDELEDAIADDAPADAFLNHPHPRQEVLKEFLFLGFPLLGTLLGGYLSLPAGGMGNAFTGVTAGPALPLWLQVLGGTVGGYLIGGGLVWCTRILGTLGFGKEAMGLGDVHLLAAVGAVVGGMDVLVIFFLAPFFGLIAVLVTTGLSAAVKGETRIIPYGPFLAGATLLMMFLRVPILNLLMP